MIRKLQTMGWLAALLCCTLLWATPAMAEDYDLWIAGMRLTSENCMKISSDNGFPGVTVAQGGECKYDPNASEGPTLTMKDVTIDVTSMKNAIRNKIDGLTILLSGTNLLKAKDEGLYSDKGIFLVGEGTLTIEAETAVFVNTSERLWIENIALDASGTKIGITGNGVFLFLKNANVKATGGGAAINKLSRFDTEGCAIKTPELGRVSEGQIVDAKGTVAKEVEIVPARVYELLIAGTQVTEFNYKKLSGIKGVKVTKEGGILQYDPTENTLTMKDVTVTTDETSAISNNSENLTIVVSGTNELKSTQQAGLSCNKSTKIEGNGELTIESTNGEIGLYLDHGVQLTVSDITLNVTGHNAIGNERPTSGLSVTLNNAKVIAKGVGSAFCYVPTLTTNGCSILIPEGGKFNGSDVVDKEGNVAKEVTIASLVTGVTVDPKAELAMGATKQLTIAVQPHNALNNKYTCKSSNEAVATVSETGLVTPVSLGTTTITVTTDEDGKTATCEVTVAGVKSVAITKSKTPLTVGEKSTFEATVEVVGTVEKKVKWSTSNDKVAQVNATSGEVTGVSAGTAKIVATSTADATKTAEVAVTVETPASVEDSVFDAVVVTPNPFNEQIRILNRNLRGKYSLTNIHGVAVASGTLEDAETHINTTALPTGVYLLRLTSENGAEKTFTVVKNQL